MLATMYKGVDSHCSMDLFGFTNVIGENLGDELLLSLSSKRVNKQSNRIGAFSVQEPKIWDMSFCFHFSQRE